MTQPVLEARGLYRSFGALAVIRDVTLKIEAGARHALIGPNGAGKTTLVHLLSGMVSPNSGQILLMGEDITRARPQKRVKQGLVRTFQINNLFRGLTVLENIYLAISENISASRDMIAAASNRRDIIDKADDLIGRLGLTEDRNRKVSEVPYGRQRLVELAIGLSLSPKVLLLDEPTAGVPSAEIGALLAAIGNLPKETAIIVIEHDMQVVRRIADQVTVLVAGSVLMSGAPESVISSEAVRTVYLGKSGYDRFKTESLLS